MERERERRKKQGKFSAIQEYNKYIEREYIISGEKKDKTKIEESKTKFFFSSLSIIYLTKFKLIFFRERERERKIYKKFIY